MSEPDLSAKTAVVTGANRGIGKEVALGLAKMGATVAITARDPHRGQNAVENIIARSGNSHVSLVRLDLASLASVRAAADELLRAHDQINILVNNAGAMIPKREETEDGFELTFGANHLGPFLLTSLLLDRIKASTPARIVNLASGAHRAAGRGGLNFDDLQATNRYRALRAYGQSKLANILFTMELAERLQGSGVTVNAVHPGMVATNPTGQGATKGYDGLFGKLVRPFLRTPPEGADTPLYLATSPDLEGISGDYYTARRVARRSAAASDRTAACRLWEVSEQLVGTAS